MGSEEPGSDPWAGAPGFVTRSRRTLPEDPANSESTQTDASGTANAGLPNRDARGIGRPALPAWMRSPIAHLVPLRVFIGVGWLRAWLEKASDAAWYNGDAVREFLTAQISTGAVLSPQYEWMMRQVYEPLAAVVGWVVVFGELVIGLGVLFGAAFNVALSAGMFLNASFIAAGAISPSAFYIVIQTALLGSTVGEIASIDGWRHSREGHWLHARWFFVGAGLWFLVMVWALVHTNDVSAASVNDPGAVLAFVSGLSAAMCLVVAVRRRGL